MEQAPPGPWKDLMPGIMEYRERARQEAIARQRYAAFQAREYYRAQMLGPTGVIPGTFGAVYLPQIGVEAPRQYEGFGAAINQNPDPAIDREIRRQAARMEYQPYQMDLDRTNPKRARVAPTPDERMRVHEAEVRPRPPMNRAQFYDDNEVDFE